MSPALRSREHSLGVALTVTSSVTFGASPVLAKAAFGAGVGVSSLLGARFAIAAVLLWAVIAIRRPALPPLRLVLAALALGGVGFAAEAALHFSALERLDASLVVLLLATYPAIVVVVAVALGRERADRRRGLALGASLGGAALVFGGLHATGLDGDLGCDADAVRGLRDRRQRSVGDAVDGASSAPPETASRARRSPVSVGTTVSVTTPNTGPAVQAAVRSERSWHRSRCRPRRRGLHRRGPPPCGQQREVQVDPARAARRAGRRVAARRTRPPRNSPARVR